MASRRIIITGAAAGLGRALCEHYGAAGARIAAIDRDAERLAQTAEELRAAGIELRGFVCDVSSAAESEEAFGMAREWMGGGIDILINNAGISQRSGFANTIPAVFERVMSVNFLGTVYWTRLALPDLLESRGNIITLSSVSGYSPLIGRTAYAASKHALHGFIESLRAEIEDGAVHLMLVCPSFIATEINVNALGGDGQPARHDRVVLGNELSPERVAQLIDRALRRRKRLLLIGKTAHVAYWCSRWFPRFYARMMRRRLRDELVEAQRAGKGRQ